MPLGKLGNNKLQKIGLLGSSSPLGKDLERELVKLGYQVAHFSRSPSPGKFTYDQIESSGCSVFVNLIGGNRTLNLKSSVQEILDLYETVIQTSVKLGTPIVHVSSGIIFGVLQQPANSFSKVKKYPFDSAYQELKIKIEQLNEEYRPHLQISDLRLFSFAGPEIIAKGEYFLSKLFRAAVEGKVFRSEGEAFLRDYTSPYELASAIDICLKHSLSLKANLFTAKPVSNKEILEFFSSNYGLVIDFENLNCKREQIYFANAEDLLPNFVPGNSLDAISQATKRSFNLLQ